MRWSVFMLCLLWATFTDAQTTLEVNYYAPLADANGNYSETATRYTLVCNAQSSLFVNQSSKNKVDFDEKTQKIVMNFPLGATWIYKDNVQHSLHNYITSLREKTFLISDELHPMQWEILEENKSIGNIQVQKARGKHRGRTYTAWFAPSIPLSNGPWKLGGLPGLILEAYDDEKLVVFLFQSFRPLPDQVIAKPADRAPQISLKAYQDLFWQEIKTYYDFLNAKIRKEGSTVTYQVGPIAPWEFIE